MVLKKQRLLIIFIALFLASVLSITSFAAEMTVAEKVYNRESGIMSISYRGDTSLYPENSLEGILSAKEKGADMVSVGVEKTSDGIYVLTEKKPLSAVTNAPFEKVSEITYDELQNYYLYSNTGELTRYRMVSLSQTIDIVGEDLILILDVDWDEKDGVYDLIGHYGAFERVIIRTEESARSIEKWLSQKSEKVNVIGIYNGNIIFNAVSHFGILSESEMPFIQFQSKNYFNIMYGNFFCKRFYGENAPRAIAATYDPDFSGQRSDSEEGWNELLELGYSVIETNNIVSLVSYIDRAEKMKSALASLTEKAEKIDISGTSQVLSENFTDALELCKDVLSGVGSLDESESAYSALLLSMNELNISEADDTQKGQLNITFGKIIAALLVGAVIVAAQIYVHKMQEEKRRK